MSNYYEENAQVYAQSTVNADMNETYKVFEAYLNKGCSLLDLGSGSGRDAAYFAKKGHSVTALEPSFGLCTEIKKIFDGPVVNKEIRDYHPESPFDAIWACASLLHLKEADLLFFFEHLDEYLKKDGVIYVSGKNGIETGLDEKGRYFLNFDEELLDKIKLVHPGIRVEKLWYSEDVTGRTEFRWMNFILENK